MTPPIAIIGGGPSGLTFARLLERNGIDYVVYERDASAAPTPGQQGGSLDLRTQTGQLALKSAGLFDEFKKYARWEATTVVVTDKHGKTHADFGEGRDAPEIDRVHLRRLLLDSIPLDKVRWGHAVKDTHRDEDSGDVVITFANGASATGFKLVVGADGAWSKVRHLLTPAKPLYSGKQYFESYISVSNPFYPTLFARVGHGMFMAMGDGKKLIAQQMCDGSYRVYLGLSVPEDFFDQTIAPLGDGNAGRSFFLSSPTLFADWAPELKDILSHADPGPLRPWPLYYLPAEAVSWPRVRGVTLLGDAAHLSTPFVGGGVNCGMHDSLVLAEKIKEYGLEGEGLEGAVGDYEKDMLARGRDLIERSSASEALMFAEDAPASFLEVILGKVGKEKGVDVYREER